IKRGRPYEQIDGNPELSKYYRDLYEMYENNFMKDYLDKNISHVYVLDFVKMDFFNQLDDTAILDIIEEIIRKERCSVMAYDFIDRKINIKITLNNYQILR